MREELINDIAENVDAVRKKKKKNKIDFSRFNTQTLTDKLKSYEFDPENYLKIYNILKARQGGAVMCKSAKMQLEREVRLGINPVHFGHKNEAYDSEKNMLKEHSYTFEDLSPSERQIYNNAVKFCRI
jgi:hypothetical protein